MALYDVSTSEKKTNPELVAGGTLYASAPIGTILPFGGSSDKIVSGWALCDGSAVSRTTYAELFAVIGTAFGSGDGSTTFNLPDMRESVPKGAGLTGKTVGNHVSASGLVVGEFIDDRIQATNNATSVAPSFNWAVSSGGSAGYTGRSNIRYGVTTEVKSVGVNYIICMKQTAVPADFLAKVEAYNSPDWANARAITLNTTGYTIPDDGWVVGTGLNLADSTIVKILVNGVTVASSIGVTSYHSLPSIQVKVNKGDIIKISTGTINNQDFHFVPHK